MDRGGRVYIPGRPEYFIVGRRAAGDCDLAQAEDRLYSAAYGR